MINSIRYHQSRQSSLIRIKMSSLIACFLCRNTGMRNACGDRDANENSQLHIAVEREGRCTAI
jgi:hypothetical protein